MVNVNIRMDENLKKQFEFYCTELGMNMTTAMNIFARAVVREGGLPFELKINIPNAETIAAMQEGDSLLANPSSKRFTSVDEVFQELNS